MLRCTLLVVLIPALLVGILAPVGAAPKGMHQDNRLGYKIRYPKGWTQIPIKADEQWLAAKYISGKNYLHPDKASGATYTFKPDMSVIVFVEAVVKKDGVEIEETEGGLVIDFNNPYKNYKDYLQRTYGGGGWYVDKEETKKIGGLETTCYEIKVEKLAIPKRIVTWVFHTDDVDYAVEFEVLEKSYKKLRSTINSSLKSFRVIPRTEGSLSTATTGGSRIVIEGKLTQAERRKHRLQVEKTEHEKAGKNLPAGWKVKKIGRFLVLDHVGDNFKHAKKVCTQLEALWRWLDKNLGEIGTGEFVPQPIIRICDNPDEERAFLTSGGWNMGLEIVTHKDRSAGSASWEMEYVNRRFLKLWLRFRDKDLHWAQPWWLEYGLEQVLGTARAKGRKLVFQADQWEKEGLREVIRAGTVTRPADLIKMTKSEFSQSEYRPKEAGALVRFLMTGAASKNRRTKTVLRDYLLALSSVIRKIDAEDRASAGEEEKEPETSMT